MPAEPPHERPGQQVERADEQAVVDRALPAAVQPRLHRKTLGDDLHLLEAADQPPELADAELQEDQRVVVLESDLHQLRQGVQP